MGREGRDYWEEQLSEYWDSGLTIQEYSELKELPYESTRRWIRVLEKARQDGAIGSASLELVEVKPLQVQTQVARRTNRFREDPEVPTGSATNADYRKSGYDRGHLAPAADMAFSVQTMADSFFFSNMSPQVPAFNRGIWKRLEEQVRKFALQEGEIMVVTGPVLPKEKSITIGNNKVTVPDRYYKVVYDLTPPQKMIGFIIPNSGSTRPLQDFAVTVDAVEKETGLNFFSLVPRQEQDRLESTITLDAWSW